MQVTWGPGAEVDDLQEKMEKWPSSPQTDSQWQVIWLSAPLQQWLAAIQIHLGSVWI